LTIALVGLAYWPIRTERKNQAVIHWHQDVAPMLHEDQRLNGSLRVFWNEESVQRPTLITVYITNVGRADIGTKAFDARHPIVIRFNAPVVALIEPAHPDIEDEILPIRRSDNTVRIGPGLLKRGTELKVVALTDGSNGAIISFPLEQVRTAEAASIPRAEYLEGGRVSPARFVAALGIALGAILITLSTFVAHRNNEGNLEPKLATFIGSHANCDLFRAYAQNQWDPVGAEEHFRPTMSSNVVKRYGPNTVIPVDGWVHGSADFTVLGPPFNSDVWFHVGDGSGWIPAAGLRSAPTKKPALTSPNGGPAVQSTANCEGSAE
jgi:hypothetical protein